MQQLIDVAAMQLHHLTNCSFMNGGLPNVSVSDRGCVHDEPLAAGACQPGRVRCREDVQLGGGRAVRVGAPVLQRSGGRRGGGVQSAALTEVPAVAGAPRHR